MPTIPEIARWLFDKRTGMFDRYTEHARRTIFFGRWEALQVGSPFIGPDHIALGILRDSWLIEEILKEFTAEELRKEIVAELPKAAMATDESDIPLNAAAKRLLRFAAAEADSLIDTYIGDEHILLAFLQTGNKNSGAFSRVISAKLNPRDLRLRIKAIPRETRKKSGNAQGANWREAGMPDGYTTSRVLYNPAAETLVLEVKALKGDSCPKRLLIRHRTAKRYEEICSPAEDISYESPATCEKLPIVVFNCKKYNRRSDGQYIGADWEGAYAFNLETKELNLCLSKENFALLPPYDERGWIREVCAISDDALYAYVIVGLGKRKSDNEVYYDYHLAKLDLRTKRLELLSQLKNTFF